MLPPCVLITRSRTSVETLIVALELSGEELGDGISVVQLIVRSGLAKSGKEAKRLIAEHGARLDDAPLTDAGLMIDAGALASPIKLSAGKKRHALVKLAD